MYIQHRCSTWRRTAASTLMEPCECVPHIQRDQGLKSVQKTLFSTPVFLFIMHHEDCALARAASPLLIKLGALSPFKMDSQGNIVRLLSLCSSELRFISKTDNELAFSAPLVYLVA